MEANAKKENGLAKASQQSNGDNDSDRPLRPLTSYERNKQNNMKSNIVLPTALSTSTDDSTCVDDGSWC